MPQDPKRVNWRRVSIMQIVHILECVLEDPLSTYSGLGRLRHRVLPRFLPKDQHTESTLSVDMGKKFPLGPAM